MKKIIRKIKKLFRSPNEFWRDFFIKRSPIKYKNGVESLPEEVLVAKAKPNSVIAKPSTASSFILRDLNPINFPIDVVYTWVDGYDKKFIEEKSRFESLDKLTSKVNKPEIYDEARFISCDELKFSLRSVELYAPWVNHIYVVTNGQIPKWLNLKNPKISLVRHSDIIDHECLPTFNSHVIESCLHRIEGLSEHYLYLNDDVMFTRPVEPSYFFLSSGIAKVFSTNVLLNNASKTLYDTPTQWAAKNARDFLWEYFGVFPSNLFAHTFHPQVKHCCFEIETTLGDKASSMRKNKFRSQNDFAFATFLHHHYAILKGYALATQTSCMYFNVRTPSAVRSYKSLLARKGKTVAPWSMCLNDHVSFGAATLENYESHLLDFLLEYFPVVSSFEDSSECISSCLS
jgi:hypothetical protein